MPPRYCLIQGVYRETLSWIMEHLVKIAQIYAEVFRVKINRSYKIDREDILLSNFKGFHFCIDPTTKLYSTSH